MNGATDTTTGLNPGRNWSALPDQDQPLEWSLDPAGDFIQGPLKLVFLRGKRILLDLAEGQLAMLQEGNELRAVFLDGGHILEVGTRPGQASPDGSLFFLSSMMPVHLRWTHGNPIDLPGMARQHVIGSCSLVVTGPARFFESFMMGQSIVEADDVREAMETVARKALKDYLAGLSQHAPADSVGLQSTLMNLQADTLSEELAGAGLGCLQLALYTAEPPVAEGAEGNGPEQAQPQDRTGQSGHLAHN